MRPGGCLWVVTPTYLDVESFVLLRRRLLDVVAADENLREHDIRFVVVDDTAGRDAAVAELDELPAVRVIEPPFNLGHQRAIVFGLRTIAREVHANDTVVTLDSDGEDRPEDVPRLVAPLLEADGAENVAVAVRTKRQASLGFKVFYFLFRLGFHALTGVSVRSGNFAAYRGWFVRAIIRHPYFDHCYSSTLIALNVPVHRVPTPRGNRYAGTSRMSYASLVRHGLSMLMPFIDRIAVRALVLFSVTMALSVALAVTVVCVRVFSNAGIPGWATTTTLLLVVLSFVALGNFIVLFAVFSQSQGMSLADLEKPDDRTS